MRAVCLEMQGVRIEFLSDDAEVLRHVQLHFPHLIVPTAAGDGGTGVQVRLRWFEAGDAGDLAFPGQGQLDRIGKRVLAGGGTLVWTELPRFPNLALRIRLDGERLEMDARYVYAPRPEKLAARPHYRARQRFELMTWLVLHPLSWYLDRFRGFGLLHAAAVELGRRGVVIAGPGGVGKTTTAVALLAHGGRMLSENLVFHDAAAVYSCYEPIRLDTASLELLGSHQLPLHEAPIPAGVKGKNLYHVEPAALAEAADGALLVVPYFAHAGSVRALDLDTSLERLLACNTLARECGDYAAFAATLKLVWPTPGAEQRRLQELRALLEHMQRLEIGVAPEAGLEPVVSAIVGRAGLRAGA